LNKLDGVHGTEVDFATKIATIKLRPTSKLTEVDFEKALKDKGYGVTSFEMKAPEKAKEYNVVISGMT
jgi:uncharacterized protein YebE (UPF0316 family)